MTVSKSSFKQAPSAYGSVMRRLCRWILRLAGWKYSFKLPETKKFVIIGAPHTTNWDFVIMLLVTRAEDLRLNWVGKDSLFRGPFNGLMRWLEPWVRPAERDDRRRD